MSGCISLKASPYTEEVGHGLIDARKMATVEGVGTLAMGVGVGHGQTLT